MKSRLLGAVSSTKQFQSLAVAAAAGLSLTPAVQAADFIWSGDGADTNFSTGTNWIGGVSPGTFEDTLIFDSANGISVFTANNDDAGAPLFHRLSFGSGDFTLTGNELALTQSFDTNYDLTLISVNSGTQTISADMVFQPLSIDGTLSPEIVDLANINIATGSTLNLQGNIDASQLNRLYISGGGQVDLGGALTANVLSLFSATTLSGTNGAFVGANPGASASGLVLGANSRLTLDNGTDASGDRLGDSMDVYLDRSASSTPDVQGPAVLQLLGSATQAVAEQAGELRVRVGYNESATNDVHSIELLSSGQATSVTFDGLSYYTGTMRNTTYASQETVGVFDDLSNVASGGRLDFKATDLGGEQQVFFTTAPALVDGLLTGVTVNRTELSTYDVGLGVKAATTTNSLSGAGVADNVLVDTDETVSNDLTINSLAVANATISASTTPETISLNSGQMLISGNSTVDANIDFGSSAGRLDLPGSVVFNGALSGSSGLNVISGGAITLNAESTLNSVSFNGNDVTLGINDALAGSAASNFGGSLDIGNTTQHVASYFGSELIGSGSLIATTGDLEVFSSSPINADLQAAVGKVGISSSAMNGNIQAPEVFINSDSVVNGNIAADTSVSLQGSFDLIAINGTISGTADVTAHGAIELTGANTYTGSTTIARGIGSKTGQTISGGGSIASSSSVTITDSSLSLVYAGTSVDRIGNAAPLSLSGGTLNLSTTGLTSVNEDIGAVSVGLQSRITVGDNMELSADSLSIGGNAGDELLVNVSPSAKLLFGGTLAKVGSSNILDKVYIDKAIGSGSLPAWTTYDATDGVREAVIDSTLPLSSAGSDAFVRVTNSNNVPLNSNKTVGAVVFDLQNAVTGTGTLTLGTGQMAFYQDANILIDAISFGNADGRISNAGNNVINSNLSGTNGFKKLGTGAVELAGANDFSGGTVSNDRGALIVTGSLTANTVNGNITQKNGGQITASQISGLQLVNSSFSTASGRTVSSVHVDGDSTFNNVAANTNTIGVLTLDTGAQATNSGNVDTVANAGTFTNDGSVDQVSNYTTGVVDNTGSVSLGNGSNSNILNNAGSLYLSGSGYYLYNHTFINTGTINSSGTITVDENTIIAGDGSLVQSNGTTTVNGIVENDIELNGGILKGAGIIRGNVNNTGGSIQPGNSPGDFRIEGDLVLGSGGSIVMEFGNAATDGLSVTGLFDAQAGSEIVFDLLDGLSVEDVFTPAFDLNSYFSYGSASSTNPFASIMLMASSDSGNFTLAFDESGAFVNSAPAVPVPAAVWLFGSGLLGLIGVGKRKKAA